MKHASGIWARSSPIGQKEWVIFCVGQSLIRITAFYSYARDRGLNVKRLMGCYKGKQEQSFLIAREDFPQVEDWTRDEDSILVLGRADARNQCPATLVYANGRQEKLGLFRSVSRDIALSSESWTFDPMTQTYFACV